MEFLSNSLTDTAAFAKKIAEKLISGDIIALYGDLGAGKTALTKALALALGYEGEVTSPTFTLVNEYEARLPIYHFDMYRLEEPQEALDAGLDEILNSGEGVCIVEWPENLGALLPKCKKIYIEKIDENSRKFRLEEE